LSTSDRATAPLNAFEVLAIRISSVVRIGARVRRLPKPARATERCAPRWTTAIAPGGPPSSSRAP
jgi:hypothetical protein